MFKLRSGFIVGGLIGAAAAMVIVRNRPETAAKFSNAVSNAGSKLASWAVSGLVNRSWGKAAQAMAVAPKKSKHAVSDSKADWGTIETIVNSDPALKQEVSRIREEASIQH